MIYCCRLAVACMLTAGQHSCERSLDSDASRQVQQGGGHHPVREIDNASRRDVVVRLRSGGVRRLSDRRGAFPPALRASVPARRAGLDERQDPFLSTQQGRRQFTVSSTCPPPQPDSPSLPQRVDVEAAAANAILAALDTQQRHARGPQRFISLLQFCAYYLHIGASSSMHHQQSGRLFQVC
jgi:hypothetical protein